MDNRFDCVVSLVELLDRLTAPQTVTIMVATREAAALAWKLLAVAASKKKAVSCARLNTVKFKNNSVAQIVCAKDFLLAGREITGVWIDE